MIRPTRRAASNRPQLCSGRSRLIFKTPLRLALNVSQLRDALTRGFLIIWEGRTGPDAVEGVGLNCF
jgi:hypothetical protein